MDILKNLLVTELNKGLPGRIINNLNITYKKDQITFEMDNGFKNKSKINVIYESGSGLSYTCILKNTAESNKDLWKVMDWIYNVESIRSLLTEILLTNG